MAVSISVLLASWRDDDRSRILANLKEQNDFLIAGVEKDEAGAVIKSEYIKPDVLILDLQSSGIDGARLAPIIHRRSPSTAIVLLCGADDDNYASMALKAGISAFLLKEADTDKLIPVVRIVFSGGYYVSASIILRVFGAVPPSGRQTERGSLFFSTAERRVVTCVAMGFSDREIAGFLNFSAGTIKNYLGAIKRKTKLKNRMQIVMFSLFYGLINMEPFDIRGTALTDLQCNLGL